MKTAQQGKGFAQVLILVAAAILVGAVLLYPQLTKKSYTSTPTTYNQQTNSTQTPAVAGEIALMLDPADVSATVGKTFTVNVNVDTKTDSLSAAELHLTYDPALVEATAVKNGTFLPVVLTPGKMDAGTASLVVGSNPTTPQKGTGTIATVTFTAKKAGNAMISIDKTTQVAAISKTGNQLGSTTGTTVTIK
jgi:Cohesin domain